MQVLGLEIRKMKSLPDLYKNVDIVLKDFNINAVKKGAVAHSLQKMLQAKKHFSICTIDQCIAVSQISIPKERYDIYRSQHCVNWNEMLPEFRQVLIAMILEDFKPILLNKEG